MQAQIIMQISHLSIVCFLSGVLLSTCACEVYESISASVRIAQGERGDFTGYRL